MDIIDDHGRLFGRINIIDALVLLLVVAVLIAGIAFVGLPQEREDGLPERIHATRYATLDLGERDLYIATTISRGDSMAARIGFGNLTVTGVHVTPTGDGNASVVISVKIHGLLSETKAPESRIFMFNGSGLQRGTRLQINTDTYQTQGTITRLDTTPQPLPTGETEVLLETILPVTTASIINAGDGFRFNERPVATVESVTVYPTDNATEKRVMIGLTLRTINQSGSVVFAGKQVKIGTALPVVTDSYELSGVVVRLNGHTPPGVSTETTVELKLTNIDPEIADGIRVGMTETHGGTVYARITEKHSGPATVVLTSGDGQIFKRAHPVNKDIYLTVALQTRRIDDGLMFRARSLQEGNTITLDLGSITIRGTVIDIE